MEQILLTYDLPKETVAAIMMLYKNMKVKVCSPDGNTYYFDITDADYTDDIALLANTPTQAETLQHNLEWATSSIGLHVNADKTEYMCFNQRGDISTLNGGPLKLVDEFTYLGSSVSHQPKMTSIHDYTWTAIGHMEVRPVP